MSRRIAPTLRLIMECVQDTPGLNLCEESEKRAAAKELRALLGVVRSAQKVADLAESTHENGGQVCGAEWFLINACRRLARVSKGER